MKITLYMATTIDGFIATTDGDSDWVSEEGWDDFDAAIREHRNIILGSRTYKQYINDLYPVQGVNNIVITEDPGSIEPAENVFAAYPNPQDVISFLEERGQEQALLIGGGKTNGLFLEADLVDELRIVVHPMTLGNGIKLFEESYTQRNFDFIESQELGDGLIMLKYRRS